MRVFCFPQMEDLVEVDVCTELEAATATVFCDGDVSTVDTDGMKCITEHFKSHEISVGSGSVILLRERRDNTKIEEPIVIHGKEMKIQAEFFPVIDAIIPEEPSECISLQLKNGSIIKGTFTLEEIVHLELRESKSGKAKSKPCHGKNVTGAQCKNRTLTGYSKQRSDTTSCEVVFLCWRHKRQAIELLSKAN